MALEKTIQFETPENVEVRYELAGLGTRLVAWIEDQLLVFVLMLVFIFLFVLFGMGSHWLGRKLLGMGRIDATEFPMYFVGLVTILMGFINFLYYSLSELLMRGQTIGKKHAGVRVVKVNGYSLDAGSILIRNLFRIIDHMPPLWAVPAFSQRHQRLGDMVAGTVCIKDEPQKLGGLRETLSARGPAEREFRFDMSALRKARPADTVAVERILESRETLSDEQLAELAGMVCDPLAQRMNVRAPEAGKRVQFLEDYLAAEYQRQQRNLG